MSVDVEPLVAWLQSVGPGAGTAEELLAEFARRLVAAGVPVARVAVFVRTLHPNFAGRGLFWRAEHPEAIETTSADYQWMGSDAHRASPVHAIAASGEEIRRRLADPACRIDFPVLAELRAEGMTDYLAAPLRSISGERMLASFTTRAAAGFGEAELNGLRRVLAPFARLAEIVLLARKARNILNAYLGEQAGEKVLAGAIRRGDGEEIRAVIWFCDLRDSTVLADSMSRAEFLHLLNDFFERVLGPVLERKGEVLRFIGDAALAIFPVGERPAEACEQALAAALEAMRLMDEMNAARARPLGFGIGLHLGDVLYGNVGTPSRIEFTVIGAAANEAARIEALCKDLGVRLLVSEAVARHLSAPLRSLGRHRLRGVGESVELFTPRKKN